MHISLLPPSSPPRSDPERAAIDSALVWLREELQQSTVTEQQAALRHEMGILEELSGRDAAAVKEFLAAVNSVATFREPLERLIVLIERHRSFKNLPTLLDHFCQVAEGEDEIARAQLASAWLYLGPRRDVDKATAATEAVLQAAPLDPAGLLTLERLARQTGDTARLNRALVARHDATRSPEYKTLLQLDLASTLASAGDRTGAWDLLQAIPRTGLPVALATAEQQIALAVEAGRKDWLTAALSRQLDLLNGPQPGDGSVTHVPVHAQAPEFKLDLLLRLAHAQHSIGEKQAALTTLERARSFAPESPEVAHALMKQAALLNQPDRLEELALAELDNDYSGNEAAALWVQVAQARRATHNLAGAALALDRALEASPAAWLARAMAIDLARGCGDASAHARSLERTALELSSPTAKSRYWLAAADVWARQAGDAESAMQALSCAETAGMPAALVHRVGRGLAQAVGDHAWYEAATRFLLEAEVDTKRRTCLALEMLRSALLERDRGEVSRCRRLLESLPEGTMLGSVVRACLESAGNDSEDALSVREALDKLSAADPASERSVALRWVGQLPLADADDRTNAVLLALHAEHPARAAVTGTLVELFSRRAETRLAAVEALTATAAATTDDVFSGSLYIEAGVRAFRAGHRSAAFDAFTAARKRGAGCASALQNWTEKANESNPTADSSHGDPAERVVAFLQRDVASGRSAAQQVEALLAAADNSNDQELVQVGAAARLLVMLTGLTSGGPDFPRNVQRFGEVNTDCQRLAVAWSHLRGMADSSTPPKTLEENARTWFETTRSVAAALEWLGAAQRLRQRERECEARSALSRLLEGNASELCASSSALTWHLSRTEPAPTVTCQTPQGRLTNLETSPPGCAPRRRATALCDALPLLDDQESAMANLLAGYNLLVVGDGNAAAECFRAYNATFPDDPAGWEGLVEAARSSDDASSLAEAIGCLANTTSDAQYAARLFEEAADIFFTRLDDDVSGYAALVRAVELDVTREATCRRLLDLTLAREDWPALLEVVHRRLSVADNDAEVVALQWERARACRQLGDTDQALLALSAVSHLKPTHAGALALFGEIYVTTRRYEEAATKLSELAALPDALDDLRLTSGLAAVDLFENKLDATGRALAVLLNLHRAGLSTLPLRERLARAAAKSQAWDEAAVVLEQLMFERATPAECAEAARLALAIHRDRRDDPRSAGHAAKTLLRIVPTDPEALDLALSGLLDPILRQELLVGGRDALIAELSDKPVSVDQLSRLSRIATHLGQPRLRQVALGALRALGETSLELDTYLAVLDRELVSPPTGAISPSALDSVGPEHRGPVSDLLTAVGPFLPRALSRDLGAFGVGRRDRVTDTANPVCEEVSAWALAFDVKPVDLYLSAQPDAPLSVVDGDSAAVLLPAPHAQSLTVNDRQRLVRGLYASRLGLGHLAYQDWPDALALIHALCRIGGVDLPGSSPQDTLDLERQLARGLPRKVKKSLPLLAEGVARDTTGPRAWIDQVLKGFDRVAAVAIGDASIVLADVQPQPTGGGGEATDRVASLIRFVLSRQFEQLRTLFGITSE